MIRYTVHENFNYLTVENDIAVVELEEPLEFNE